MEFTAAEMLVDELVGELLDCSNADLDERVRALELERRRLESELALTVAEIDRRRAHLDDGHRSLTSYLMATCNYSHAEAARVRRFAEAASFVPWLADAVLAGHVGTPQANEVAIAWSNRRVRGRLLEFAPMLLELAERLPFREFRACVKRFVMFADLDGAHGAHDDLDQSIANRRAHVVNLNGSLCLDAHGGDPLVNVELAAIFDMFCDLEDDADVAARKAQYGDLAEHHDLPRTAAQRSYDAFVAVMRGAKAHHATGRPTKATEVLVSIVMTHEAWSATLAGAGLAADTDLTGETIDPFTGTASPMELLDDLLAGGPDAVESLRCETSTGQVLHPHTVLRAALAGHIRRAVLGADSLPINLGRTSRVFTGPAREAAMLLATTCDHPGCGLPGDWCEVDHSTEWHEGGETDQDNAGIECRGHNRHKHRKRWRTRRDIHGRMHTIRADGTIMLPVGTRPPTFPHDVADVDSILTDWITRSTDHADRTCRQLRATAIRASHATGDDLDLSGLQHREPPAA